MVAYGIAINCIDMPKDRETKATTQVRQGEDVQLEGGMRYRSLFDNMLEGLAYCRMIRENGVPVDFVYLEVNPSFEKLTGLKDVVGKTVNSVIPGISESNPELFAIYGRVADGGAPERFETHVGPLGIWLSISVYSPSREHFVAVFDNITQRKEVEQALERESNKNSMLLHMASDGIHILDTEGDAVLVNDAFCSMLGYTVQEMQGMNVSQWDGKWSASELKSRMNRLTKESSVFETRHRRKDGSMIDVEINAVGVEIEGSRLVYASAREITERKAAKAQIEFLAYHDALTGLPNRLLVKDHMELAASFVERAGTRMALLFLDLDNFKSINDSLGHATGDELLKAVASRLKECVSDTDTISRQGGDEFLILLPYVRDAEVVTEVSEKILECFAEPFVIHGQELSTSFSMGIAVYPENGGDFETLLKKADTAMYKAKEAGKNTYCYHTDEMTVDAIDYLQIRNNLRRALERGEFVLHYQPQIELASGAVIGAEALIRWQHPELGMLPPSRFIPVAEDSGLIVQIGEWVIRETCRQAALWQCVVAVNLSAVQFKRGDLVKTVSSALYDSGLEPAQLELELTESILIQDTENVLGTVRQLKSLGVKLAIDDFGTGYSSLSYLKRFDFDKLKIDQSFIRDMASNPNDSAIVRAVIQMAHSLNLKAIAEGVEDERELAVLRLQHCDEVQGYHFARPMPAEDFLKFLAGTRHGV